MEQHDKLENLLERMMDLRARGEPTTAEEICKDCPDQLPALRERLAIAAWGDRLVDSTVDATRPVDIPANIPSPPDLSFLRPAQQPDEIGRLHGFRILRILGMGGMGCVFAAEDPLARRTVAIKVMRPDYAATPLAKERFLREAQAAAAIEHDHVVPIYQVGEDNGVLFLTMPLLSGETIAEFTARGGRMPLTTQLQVGREIAEGLDAAHSKGLYHRDIKPANIWLEQRKRTGAAGKTLSRSDSTPPSDHAPFRVKLLDFGLAQVTGAASTLSHSGAVLGTLGYMSPEQLNVENVDARTDLFSLGCVLYELATGRRAFAGIDAIGLLKSMTGPPPAPPCQINADMPREFSDLIMSLLTVRREDRPPSAHAVAEALRGIDDKLRGSPAERTSPPARRVPSFWMALALVPLLIFLVVMAIQFNADLGELNVVAADEDVEVEIKQGGRLVTTFDPKSQQKLALRSGTYDLQIKGQPSGLKLDQVKATLKRGETTVARIERTAKKPPSEERVRVLPESIHAVALSPDGSLAAAAGGHLYRGEFELVRAGNDFGIRVWETASRKERLTLLGHSQVVSCCVFSHDGQSLASSSGDRTARTWDIATGKPIAEVEHSTSIVGITFSRDDRQILTAGWGALLQLWNSKTGAAGNGFRPPIVPLTDWQGVAVSPDGVTAAACGANALLTFPLQGGSAKRLSNPPSSRVVAVQYSQDAARLLTVDRHDGVNDWTVRVWDLKSGEQLRHVPGTAAAFASADGSKFLVGDGKTFSVALWETDTGRKLDEYSGHTGTITSISVSSDFNTAISGSVDCSARVWDLAWFKAPRSR